jgi:hypothetical protein
MSQKGDRFYLYTHETNDAINLSPRCPRHPPQSLATISNIPIKSRHCNIYPSASDAGTLQHISTARRYHPHGYSIFDERPSRLMSARNTTASGLLQTGVSGPSDIKLIMMNSGPTTPICFCTRHSPTTSGYSFFQDLR